MCLRIQPQADLKREPGQSLAHTRPANGGQGHPLAMAVIEAAVWPARYAIHPDT